VTLNAQVHGGLTWAGARWAFTTGYMANWHPLTWLSHMTDVSLFELNPAGHHATNLLLHTANTLLLFLVLRSLTRDLWRSAGVAALFAVHPAHVESVAWVAERKDLLCAAFWLATTWAYGSWVRRGGAGRYLLILFFFLAGLMSKPMIVTLPLVLMLLDYWPLGRFRDEEKPRKFLRLAPGGFAGLVLEKAPLLLMAAASSIVTVLVQSAGGAVRSLETFPVWTRVANVPVAYARYLWILIWPANLAIFYPHPGTSLSAATVFGAALLLVAFSTAAIVLRRRAPFLFVGWFWFLVTLVPVIGVVQVGNQALADRYTYVPFVGLFIAVAWGLPMLALRWRYGSVALRAGAVAALAALSLAAAAQARIWKNSETLFLHALKATKNNSLARKMLAAAHLNASAALSRPENNAEAVIHLRKALELDPASAEAHIDLGARLVRDRRLDEAAAEFELALRINPGLAQAHNNLGYVLFLKGKSKEAIEQYQEALRLQPEFPLAQNNLEQALREQGK
jgi:hypothetical protein